MPFDSKKFMGTGFVPREQKVPVPTFKDFFENGEKPVWTIRGLTGEQIARANEAGDRLAASRAMIDSCSMSRASAVGFPGLGIRYPPLAESVLRLYAVSVVPKATEVRP